MRFVVVGYGVQKKVNMTGSISKRGKRMNLSVIPSYKIFQTLFGRTCSGSYDHGQLWFDGAKSEIRMRGRIR